jgi:2-iminobutanoate/2-iminopropanoate deaminase
MAAAFGLHAIQLILAGNRTQRTQKEIEMKKSNRRNFLGRGAVAGAAAAAVALPVAARADDKPVKKVIYASGKKPDKTPLFNSTVSYGGLLFIAGVGAHVPGDIKSHTKIVLDSIEKQLEAAGSSMEKVLKANVYLNDLKDWPAMNEVFQGRFGPEPPVRTTIAAPGGIPGNSLVEIDVIACV